tara:strand:- start:30979 stop:32169 length:1191 start_codon:yes stop_codon:yes gene_type:complete
VSDKKNLHEFKLSELVDKLSHELRTPLSAILGYSELLEKSSNLDKKEKDHLKNISTSGSQLLEVINDIIEISNIESGRTQVDADVVYVDDIIKELRDKFKVQLRYKEVELVIQKDASVPDSFVVDARKLQSILFALLSNAIKFSKKGSISVGFFMEESSSQPVLKANVTDNGMGIREEDMPHIFSPFWQSDAAERSGTGLGLTTCKKLIEIFGGNIKVQSSYGEGTSVEIEVPVKSTPMQSRISIRSISPSNVKTDPSLTALIVDDLPVNRTLARIMLEMKNFKTIEAENGEEALEHYNSQNPDVVLMDISMPVMNGVEAMEKIRMLNNSGKEIPIIAITAGGHGGTRSELLEKGFSEYIQKPFKEKELFEKLSMFLPAYQAMKNSPVTSLESTAS